MWCGLVDDDVLPVELGIIFSQLHNRNTMRILLFWRSIPYTLIAMICVHKVRPRDSECSHMNEKKTHVDQTNDDDVKASGVCAHDLGAHKYTNKDTKTCTHTLERWEKYKLRRIAYASNVRRRRQPGREPAGK